jgi:lipopolysaccharide biosynthesis regulator YciM
MFDEFENEENSSLDAAKLLERYEEMIKKNSHAFFDEDEFDEIIAIYTDSRAFPKALRAAELALDQHPYSVIFLVRQAQLYGASNQIHKAFEVLSKAESFEPNN